MIVEDNELNMMIIRAIIQKIIPDVRMIEARNGEEAVRSYETDRPDIIFMDIQMPLMNGYDAARRIRALGSKNRREIPIIALTAGNEREERVRCMEAGMNDILIKPIGFDGVKSLLGSYLVIREEI
jgi:CheY-like chemotaxis protein